MSKTFRAWNIDQPQLLPPTVQDFVTKDHLARFVLGVVTEQLDLSNDFDAGFKAMRGADGLLQLDSSLFTTHRTRLVGLAATSRLPAIYGYREMVEVGGLMSYGTPLSDLYRRAATYVAKILKGAKPADLPVEQPTKFELVINLKTAKALGLEVLPSLLLAQADEVIE
jgi:putative ABC transport system substrate-binding protein